MKRGFLNDTKNINPKSKDGQEQPQQRMGSCTNGLRDDFKAAPNHFRSEDRVGVTFNRGPSAWGTTSAWGSSSVETQSQSQTRISADDTMPASQSHQHHQQPQHQHGPWTNLKKSTHETAAETADGLSHVETIHPSLTGTDISCMTSDQSIGTPFPDTGAMKDDTPTIVNAATNLDRSIPYAGEPLLPCKTTGVPKAALSGWYGQKPRSHQLSKLQYVCWHDGGMPHKLQFSCVFVCPLTGECFASGRYGADPKAYHVEEDSTSRHGDGGPAGGTGGGVIVWYKKKANAEHGAAARAYDCFSYRHYFATSTRSVHLGLERPYLEMTMAKDLDPTSLPPPLPVLPAEVQTKIDTLKQKLIRDVKYWSGMTLWINRWKNNNKRRNRNEPRWR
ncbi:hypothetical protein MHU86_16761 [Fragilaria crotonensis]|nr:hypothetical protein MHU86_16761 [Fragilaria crotonensis]